METTMGPPTKIEHNGLALEVSHLPYLKVPDVWKNVFFSEMQPCGLDSHSRDTIHTRDAPCKVKPSRSAAPWRGQNLSLLGLPCFDLPATVLECVLFSRVLFTGLSIWSWERCHGRKAGWAEGCCAPSHRETVTSRIWRTRERNSSGYGELYHKLLQLKKVL